ncbi:Ferrichrome-iron receptor precursor [compost metagenome]
MLYGDQAVGGVINIITRRPSQNEAYVETARGSHDLETYRGHLNQMLGAGFSLFASGESRQNDNYRDNNNASYSNLFTRLRYDHDLGWALYEYQSIDDELRYPGSLTLAQRRLDRKATSSPQDFNDNKTQVHRFALEHRLSDVWAANFDYSHSDQDGVGEFFGAFEEGLRIESLSPRLTARWDTTLGKNEWLFGHDHITSDYELSSTGTESRQTLRDWYTQLSQPLGHELTLTLGYRASEAEDRDKGAGRTHTDQEGSSSIGLSWQADTNTRLFLKREDVLRWANVNENGFTLPGVSFLKPQKGESYESGVEWQDHNQHYQLSVYRLDLKDELMYDSEIANPSSFFGGKGANINLDKTRRQGALVEGRRQLTDALALNGQYSFTDSEYLDGSFKGNQIPWVARHTASAAITYQIISGLSAYVEGVYTGSRYRVSDDANQDEREGGYTLWNAALTYEYQNFNSKLRINNLTGKRYDAFVYNGATAINPAPEEDVQLSVGYRF